MIYHKESIEAAAARLRELLAKATPGPWKAPNIRYRKDALDWRNIVTGEASVLVGSIRANEYPPGDADLIVAAVNALPMLLDALEALPTAPAVDDGVTDEQIKHMVERFLGWKLPTNFSPDAGISFKPEFNVEWNAKQGLPPQRHVPSGTNLFDFTQAMAMVRHMVEGLPAAPQDARASAFEGVTQADRHRAADLVERCYPFEKGTKRLARFLRAGRCDTALFVQAFAAHRRAALSIPRAVDQDMVATLQELVTELATEASKATRAHHAAESLYKSDPNGFYANANLSRANYNRELASRRNRQVAALKAALTTTKDASEDEVERVARAIVRYRYKDGFNNFDELIASERKFVMGEARAAIAALRSPSKAGGVEE